MTTPAREFLKGCRDALPVTLTFSVLFVVVGAHSQASGLDLAQGLALTALVFAAPAQMAATDLIAQGAWLPALLAIVVINFRFLLMSASITPYLGKPPRSRLLASVQMLSASTFATSFIPLRENRLQHPLRYFLGVCAASFPTAILATGVGYLVQDTIPPWLQQTMTMVLPIYFVTFLARVWPKTRFLAAGALGLILTPVANSLLPGFGLIVTALVVAAFLMLLEPGTCPKTI